MLPSRVCVRAPSPCHPPVVWSPKGFSGTDLPDDCFVASYSGSAGPEQSLDPYSERKHPRQCTGAWRSIASFMKSCVSGKIWCPVEVVLSLLGVDPCQVHAHEASCAAQLQEEKGESWSCRFRVGAGKDWPLIHIDSGNVVLAVLLPTDGSSVLQGRDGAHCPGRSRIQDSEFSSVLVFPNERLGIVDELRAGICLEGPFSSDSFR